MTFKKNKLLSLLLAFLLAVSVFPASAFAAENCTEDSRTEPVYEIGSDTEIVEVVNSGTVGESEVCWAVDTETGRLTISGNGGCETFTSAEDQPWAHLRGEIHEVWFNNMDSLSIENLAYWFDGCTALHTTEIPYTTPLIGERAFANCPNLEDLKLYYYDEDEFEIAPSAFVSDTRVNMHINLITEQQLATHKVVAYAWDTCNREVHFFDVYSILPLPDCALGTCTCTGECDWYYEYIAIDSAKHNRYVRCTGCDGAFWLDSGSHSFSNGNCTNCGYSSGSGSGGYEEPETPSVCYHYYTSTSWSGCDWYEYCDSCDELVDYGTSHGTYSYGSWEYYNTSRHRRSYACSDCGEGSYSYGYHSTTTKYSKYNATQHTKGSYCSSAPPPRRATASPTEAGRTTMEFSTAERRPVLTVATAPMNMPATPSQMEHGQAFLQPSIKERLPALFAATVPSKQQRIPSPARRGQVSPQRSTPEPIAVPVATLLPKRQTTL